MFSESVSPNITEKTLIMILILEIWHVSNIVMLSSVNETPNHGGKLSITTCTSISTSAISIIISDVKIK
jgi:hypothetical protein